MSVLDLYVVKNLQYCCCTDDIPSNANTVIGCYMIYRLSITLGSSKWRCVPKTISNTVTGFNMNYRLSISLGSSKWRCVPKTISNTVTGFKMNYRLSITLGSSKWRCVPKTISNTVTGFNMIYRLSITLGSSKWRCVPKTISNTVTGFNIPRPLNSTTKGRCKFATPCGLSDNRVKVKLRQAWLQASQTSNSPRLPHHPGLNLQCGRKEKTPGVNNVKSYLLKEQRRVRRRGYKTPKLITGNLLQTDGYEERGEIGLLLFTHRHPCPDICRDPLSFPLSTALVRY
ncbi:hypothetical protein J6590_001060 [Homalodisca vitripennis]|nr:hypothetical protein J6590_001060 [Homalodisca vitripennis]